MAGKRYSINYRDGQVISVAVDGKEYASADDIADEDDRAELEFLLGRNLDTEASGAGMTRTITWLFGAIGALALLFAGYAALRVAQSGAGSQSAWWILGLIFGLLGTGFAIATVLIWKAFGSSPKQT